MMRAEEKTRDKKDTQLSLLCACVLEKSEFIGVIENITACLPSFQMGTSVV